MSLYDLFPACCVEIGILQEESRFYFQGIDEARNTAVGDRASALRCRRELTQLARARLAENARLGSAGVYVWVDLRETPLRRSLVYVGIAKYDPAAAGRRRGQSIERRLEDYLTKEYSLLDLQLVSLPVEQAEQVIRSRLALMHSAKQVDSYSRKHMKSFRMGRASHVFYCDGTGLLDIEAVEAALILSANAFLDEQHQLINVSKVRSAPSRIPKFAWREGISVVSSWETAGLPGQIAALWKEATNKMAAF